MTVVDKKAPWILLVGDLAVFVLSLWLALSARFVAVTTKATFLDHLAPFSLLFLVWLLVFFIFGLYEKQAIVLRSRLPVILTQAQVVNVLIAIAFFYLIPWYGIAPKTTLFLYLVISLALVIAWRLYGYVLVAPRSRESAVVIGEGAEVSELVDHVNAAGRYGIKVAGVVSPDTPDLSRAVLMTGASVVAIDMMHEEAPSAVPQLYNLMFRGIRFIDMSRLYEDVFDRVPLSLVRHDWFLSNISAAPKLVYDALKRLMDIVIALVLGLVSLIIYPFVIAAIKLEDGGPVFFVQERIGKNGAPIRTVKFRSMTVHGEKDGLAKEIAVTRVGAFIRKTRIDELPQLWNVVAGDLSLIGPRPEVPALVKIYEAEIPYYGVRHLIKPGLSGWAQLYHKDPPKWNASKERTAMKLSYDLFYIKNRSFLLDLTIALKTVKELVSRKGV
jgi:exopolysaccharide biosynthesis polyprenyl glycosylphosphotransferase